MRDTTPEHAAQPKWPSAHEAFFGPFYYRGDHSFEGYLQGRPMTNDMRTRREVDGITRLLTLESSSSLRILDAPCGYGRHSVALAQLGHEVTGIDMCLPFVEAATARLHTAGQSAVVYQGELIALPFPDSHFDVVLNLFFSFGFYLDDRDNQKCIDEYARVLRPGGRLLFHTDVNVPLIESAQYNQPIRRRLEDGSILHIREELDTRTRRLVGRWTIDDGGGPHYQSHNYSMRVYSETEFAALCRNSGLTPIAVYGGFEAETERYSATSEEMIIIAEKR